MQYRHLTLLIASASLAAILSQASEVDQSQELHTLYNDWGHGTGQAFIPAVRGLLTGIEVVIEDNNNPGTLEVYLWKADATGKPIEPKLATGYFDKTNVTSSTATWYTIPFDQPYVQTPGERLAFTIFLVTSGTDGWNEYGYVNTDTYTDGFRIYYNPPWSPGYFSSSPDSDWSFRTLVIPAPQIQITDITITNISIATPSSEPDAQYVMQTCTNLIQGAWSNIATNVGDGSPLNWDVPANAERQKFFRLDVRKKE